MSGQQQRHETQCDACGHARARNLVLTSAGGQLQLCGHHTEIHRDELERQDAAITNRDLQAAQAVRDEPQRFVPSRRARDAAYRRRVDPEADSDD